MPYQKFCLTIISLCAALTPLCAFADRTQENISHFETHLYQPHFPGSELALHHSGSADITCHVTASGLPISCRVDKATFPNFGQAALFAAINSIMLPDFVDGAPVASDVHQHYNFNRQYPNSPEPLLDRAASGKIPYPPGALDAKISGKIKVRCRVDIIGTAHDCTAEGDSELLKETALAYYSTARYVPAYKDGIPVEQDYKSSVNWELGSDTEDPFKTR
ncbi:hypothetical protein AA106555_0158 [Neokomagataea thailandica NBRC 106555]|uniref:TonB C-terminal domain-containing protein n=2 Tax=Neokomagataea TaxID=1223423 RepID=A0A4Y6V218_9PROT|nr:MULTISPECIES: energy transducer TonB [Neokomagataea]QDH24069.1 hypothetical protein D5366_00965 [Neokomagataea tanensis]GBR50297.1 hypothetical protein AA106555_0158 [Neokomagataea thailandica NBRC 106555]